MSDHESELRNPGGDSHAEFDRDVNLRAVVWTGVGLAVVTAVSFVVAWFLFRGMAEYEERQSPEPLPMPEAVERALPPGPRLQSSPEQDLEDLLAWEDALLRGYSLVEGGEYARIPIERAMELALERGLGQAAEGGPASAAGEGILPGAADVDQPGTPPGGPPAAPATEGTDAQ